jgi:hypothetical protein
MRNVTLGLALLLTMSIPLGLSGCGGDNKSVTGTVAGTKDNKPDKPQEEPLVTDAEVAKYVDAQPDSKYSFPEKSSPRQDLISSVKKNLPRAKKYSRVS